jgi:ABC-type molybdenum transport system ATPase subunit/photorepair protein PhrA
MDDSVALREKVRQFNVRLEVTKNLQANLLRQMEEATQEVEDRQNVQNVLRMMSEKLSEESETVTEKIVSLGLRDTFFDEDLSLEVSHYIAYGKPAIKLLLCDHKRRVKGDPMKAFGGGPASLIGLLLRVLSIIRQPHLARILILDEPLIQVSSKYKERAAAIVRKICEPVESGGLGFSVLVISHDEVYKQNAKHSYMARLGHDGESLSLTEQTQVTEEQVDEFTE